MLRLVFSSAIAATIAIASATVITVWAELSPALKTGLKNVTGHHWTTKSYLAVVIYLLCLGLVYWFKKEVNGAKVRQSLFILILSTLIGFVVILGFFVWHY